MNKDPAFLFYPNDWLGGTMGFTRHLKGCYIELLIAQFNLGPLSLESIKAVLGTDYTLWEVLSRKFKQDSEGNYFNENLAAEMERRKAYTESRRKSGLTPKTYAKHTLKRTKTVTKTETKAENENETETKKTNYAKTILLKQTEYNKLCADYGLQATQAAIEYLDMYKQEKNYTTKSDYLTLKRWVIAAVTKSKTHEKHTSQQGQYGPTDYIIADDGTRIYEKDIDFSKFNR